MESLSNFFLVPRGFISIFMHSDDSDQLVNGPIAAVVHTEMLHALVSLLVHQYLHVCACIGACACVRACVCVCAHAYVHACMYGRERE